MEARSVTVWTVNPLMHSKFKYIHVSNNRHDQRYTQLPTVSTCVDCNELLLDKKHASSPCSASDKSRKEDYKYRPNSFKNGVETFKTQKGQSKRAHRG